MCLLSYFPPDAMPNREHLANGCDVNRDGYGWAIVTRRRELISGRYLTADDALDSFELARDEHPDGPALFHSRWATSGLVDESMCHPFKVGRDPRTVVAHNGVLFTPPKGSDESDTAIFARKTLPMFNLDKPRRRTALEREIGGNKLVILTVNPARRHSAYLIGEQLGTWVKGAWHSNQDYLGWSRYVPSAYSWERDLADYDGWKPRTYVRTGTDCDLCRGVGTVDKLTRICKLCRVCCDCYEDADKECQCFYGNGWAKDSNDDELASWEPTGKDVVPFLRPAD
jgi:hypothetical protein